MDGVKIYSTVGSVNASLQRSQEDRRPAGPLCAANAKRRRGFQRAGILRPRVKAASRLACPLTAEASAPAGRTPRKMERGLSQAAAATHGKALWSRQARTVAAVLLRSGTLRAPKPPVQQTNADHPT